MRLSPNSRTPRTSRADSRRSGATTDPSSLGSDTPQLRYLVATDSVHTTAAACDYLEERLEDGDTVAIVTVPGVDGRASDRRTTGGHTTGGHDADDALNVAKARLLGAADVETERLDANGGADPAAAVLAAANDRNVDVIVVGPHAGVPGAAPTIGSTARRIVEAADVPFVEVPLSL